MLVSLVDGPLAGRTVPFELFFEGQASISVLNLKPEPGPVPHPRTAVYRMAGREGSLACFSHWADEPKPEK